MSRTKKLANSTEMKGEFDMSELEESSISISHSSSIDGSIVHFQEVDWKPLLKNWVRTKKSIDGKKIYPDRPSNAWVPYPSFAKLYGATVSVVSCQRVKEDAYTVCLKITSAFTPPENLRMDSKNQGPFQDSLIVKLERPAEGVTFGAGKPEARNKSVLSVNYRESGGSLGLQGGLSVERNSQVTKGLNAGFALTRETKNGVLNAVTEEDFDIQFNYRAREAFWAINMDNCYRERTSNVYRTSDPVKYLRGSNRLGMSPYLCEPARKARSQLAFEGYVPITIHHYKSPLEFNLTFSQRLITMGLWWGGCHWFTSKIKVQYKFELCLDRNSCNLKLQKPRSLEHISEHFLMRSGKKKECSNSPPVERKVHNLSFLKESNSRKKTGRLTEHKVKCGQHGVDSDSKEESSSDSFQLDDFSL